MTEIAGEYACGKTQLCYTLCVTASLPLNKGGLDGSVIFVDTENTFRSERVHQIAENRGINPDKVLQKVFVCKVLNAGQLEMVAQNLGKSIQEYNAKLVIIDSIISLHRAEFTGREMLADRQKRLNIMLNKLLRLAEAYNIAVVVTNQVQSQPDNFFADAGGLPKVTGGESILKEFHEFVVNKDPDILIFTGDTFKHLITKMSTLGFDIGREPNKVSVKRRVLLESKSFHTDLDLAGLIERARFGFLPLDIAARYGINRLIDSRNCYTLIQKGFVIQATHYRMHEPIRTVEEINNKDKAGMIFSPSVGLHENVVVLDYENEYANLIIKHNLSPETISAYFNRKERGLLPTVLEDVLTRRIFFKNLQKSFSVNTSEWVWCQQRIDTLKNILVSLYGTTGSFWNRFANVLVFEEINRLAREVLIKTKDIVQEHGFELVYADTNSVFLRKDGAPIEEYENVTKILSKEIDIPISIEQHYKFLVLLPLEASERMEALKHYFGIIKSGEIIARGIEIRRHDAPNFIKEFQTELLYTLFDCKDSMEVLTKGYENALLLVTRTIDKVMTGEIQSQDLVVTKVLGQNIDKYKSLFPHVSAAILLTKKGIEMNAGEGVEYIFTNTHHNNPLYRVMPKAFVEGNNGNFDYDKEKYRDMLLEAAETVLSIFGFNRTVYGDAPKKYKKWWQRLREERLTDRDAETIY